MSWDPTWEQIFSTRPWGKYPPEELIRFVARNYYKAPARSAVRILEIGCGSGANIWFLAREGFAATGVDGSPSAIKHGKVRLAAEGLSAELIVGDVLNIDRLFPPASFDAVIDVECLTCNRLGDVRGILGGVARVLKPGGRVFSKMFATGTYGCGLGTEIEPGTFTNITDGPLAGIGVNHFFTPEELGGLFAGFTDVRVEMASRSLENQRHWVKEWVVEGTKA